MLKKIIKKFKEYLKYIFKLVFSHYFWSCLPYSLFLLIPDQIYSLGRKPRNRDAFASIVGMFCRDIKISKTNSSWLVNLGGAKFEVPHLTNELLEIGCNFGSSCRRRLAKSLEIPFIFEGPYLTDRISIKESDCVLDIGASLGIFSVFAARAVGPTGQVLAFEPNDLVAKIMRRNFEINQIDNVKIIDTVLTDKFGDIDFTVDLNGAQGSSSIFPIKSARTKLIKARQETLDSFIVQHNIQRVDFIKADIEGAERLMLKGAEQTIKRFKPTIAIRIYHLPDDPEVIEAMLKGFVPGYKIEKFGRKTLYAYIPK